MTQGTFKGLQILLLYFYYASSHRYGGFFQVHTSGKSRTNSKMALEAERQKLQRGLSKKSIGNGNTKHDEEM